MEEKEYDIPIRWESYERYKVTANTLEEAVLKALKQLAAIQLGWSDEQLALALQHGKLFEVTDHD